MTLTAHEHAVGAGTAAPAPVGVSVVVPCRNEAPYIEGVLDALCAQDYPVREVVLVDGGSTDDTVAIVEDYARRHDDLTIRIVDAHGANISAALNAGIAESRSEVIVRMDAHSRPAPDYVRRSVAALETGGAAVVGGVWRIRPGAATATASAIARAVAHRVGAGDAAYRLASAAQPRAVDTVPFGCYRRAHWERIGGYNEHLLVNEDYEFNYRTRLAGGSILLDPSIVCDYFARPTLGALARQYFRYGWWKGRMLRQHPRSIRLRQAIPALFVPFWVAALALAAVVPLARPLVAAVAVFYLSAILAAAVQSARHQWRLAAPGTAAFVIIHTMWSAGLWLVFLTGSSALRRRRPGGRRPRAGLTGAQLSGALASIAVLALVVPFTLATRVHHARVARATQQVAEIAAAVRTLSLPTVLPDNAAFVWVGPGTRPLANDAAWYDVHVLPLPSRPSAPWPTDPWGNYYVVYPVAADSPRSIARWVISAGPNGIFDTPFRQPSNGALRGDDIGIRLQ